MGGQWGRERDRPWLCLLITHSSAGVERLFFPVVPPKLPLGNKVDFLVEVPLHIKNKIHEWVYCIYLPLLV